MSDEQLIDLVKQYPVLYNITLPEYRDHNMRHNAWEEIAQQLDITVDDARHKWGKLRNCLTNALKRRRRKTIPGASNITAPWKFEKRMKFLKPHIGGKLNDPNLSDNNDVWAPDLEIQYSEPFPTSPDPIGSPIRRASSSCASERRAPTPYSIASVASRRSNKNRDNHLLLTEMMDILKSSQAQKSPDLDANDYFFLSMSKQLKKLPKTDQAEIKFQVHKLVYESEIKMLTRRGIKNETDS